VHSKYTCGMQIKSIHAKTITIDTIKNNTRTKATAHEY
jgi:hypothetical protein